MRKFILLFCLIIFCFALAGQEIKENVSGQVSFVSSKNVYVKFKSTMGITVGDTLFRQSNGADIPVLVVNNLSSVSCVCNTVSNVNLSVADYIIARIKVDNARPEEEVVKIVAMETLLPERSVDSVPARSDANGLKQRISGNISVNSYSDFSNTPAENSQRFRYSLSLNARNLADSKFSMESYISFRHKMGEWEEVKNDIFNALKIYNLSLIYDLNKTTKISLGRKINPRISSIGAIDGLQVEKSINKFAFGAVAGSRPDYTDYGFNIDLLQFGGYLAFNSKTAKTFSESSLAFMQQMNNTKTDRRFLYFQHSGSFVRNLYFTGTFEVDLYELQIDTLNNKEQSQSTFNPTGLYLSLRYRPGNKLTVSGSYDARKNIIYYETYKTYIERMLETGMRQGFRLQANYRITRDLTLGLQSGYRYLKSDPHPSKNIYGYLTYCQIPGLNISLTISGTYLESSFMNGNIYGANISRELFRGKLQTSLGYRYVDYRLPENSSYVTQNICEMNIYWQFAREMALSINYEGTFEKQDKYNRLYLQIRKRF